MNTRGSWRVPLSSLRLRSLYPFVLHAMAEIPRNQRGACVVVDLPAGSGMLSFPLAAAGFDVRPLDLFEEYLNRRLPSVSGRPADEVFAEMSGERLPGWLHRRLLGEGPVPAVPGTLSCARADMEGTLPLADASTDALVCVEGIEHVVDRHRVLSEFRRVLRPDGRLLITTPNLLSARARVAFAVTGQRAFRSYIDEFTSVWGVAPDGARVYHGHAFLINYFQLRYSLHQCGFRIRRLWPSNWSPTSLALYPLMCPLVWLGTVATQRGARKKYRRDGFTGSGPYREMLSHLVSPNLLLNATMVIEAEAVPVRTPAQLAREHRASVVKGPSAPTAQATLKTPLETTGETP